MRHSPWTSSRDHGRTVSRIIGAYRSPVVRAYSRCRFLILRQRFLSEIGQYLPVRGAVLDVGCGFGLFGCYFAATHPQLEVVGFDLDAARIAMATEAAGRLELPNFTCSVDDAATYVPDRAFDGAYMLDIVHHIPRQRVAPLLVGIYRSLRPGGRLIVKDVDREPAYKRWFTWWLDKAIDPRAPVDYWSAEDLVAQLREVGFQTFRHAMVDVLPYPHAIYVCQKPAPEPPAP